MSNSAFLDPNNPLYQTTNVPAPPLAPMPVYELKGDSQSVATNSSSGDSLLVPVNAVGCAGKPFNGQCESDCSSSLFEDQSTFVVASSLICTVAIFALGIIISVMKSNAVEFFGGFFLSLFCFPIFLLFFRIVEIVFVGIVNIVSIFIKR
jgi:hypothetical protein